MPVNLPPFLRAVLLYPLSVLYGMGVSIRNKLFDLKILKSRSFDTSVICVGNITVGGTGKTPHVEYIIDLFRKDISLATLSRGYKRKTKDFQLARQTSTVDEIGDEPLQIKQKYPQISVAVDRDRVHGIEALIEKQKDLELIILDDAYQHRYVKPGLCILLIDYNRMITKDNLLPYGRLREKRSAKRRAHVIIITKCPHNMKPIEQRLVLKEINPFPYQNLFYTTIHYGEPVSVFNPDKKLVMRNLIKEKPRSVLLCGIGNPDPFLKYIKRFSSETIPAIYPDHHAYSVEELKRLKGLNAGASTKTIIFTTEKDAVRIRELKNLPSTIKDRMYYIPMRIKFLNQEHDRFKQIMTKYVKQNKRDGFIHPA